MAGPAIALFAHARVGPARGAAALLLALSVSRSAVWFHRPLRRALAVGHGSRRTGSVRAHLEPIGDQAESCGASRRTRTPRAELACRSLGFTHWPGGGRGCRLPHSHVL